uniref:NCK-interacting protein with SH3 domain n=1 Tax=Schistocephalus solidus TaxID=70667 RepID=A0A0X3PVR1_SCHSO
MFKTRYRFEAKYPHSISFAADEALLGLRKENDHWLLAYHNDGRLGAVPFNYVQERGIEKTADALMLINSAIAALQQSEIFDKDGVISYLKTMQEYLSGNGSGTDLPVIPTRRKESIRSPPFTSGTPMGPAVAGEAPKVPSRASAVDKLPPGLSFFLVDRLRSTTGASYRRCVHGLCEVLKSLGKSVPQCSSITQILDAELREANLTVMRSTYEHTSDWSALQEHMSRLEAKLRNLQENSWPLDADETAELEELDGFSELLCNASSDMVRTFLRDDRLPQTLSSLYQMEKKPLVRRFYLLLVIATCHIQPAVTPDYLESVLPMEILRVLGLSPSELDFVLCLRILTVLLATSSSLPVGLQSELSTQFFESIFHTVSNFGTPGTAVVDLVSFSGDSTPVKPGSPPTKAFKKLNFGDGSQSPSLPPHSARNSELSNMVIEAFVNFVMSANRHFCVNPTSGVTPIMQCISGKFGASRDLLEQLLRIFNRGDDPLALNGVAFVRTLRGNMRRDSDVTFALYEGTAIPGSDDSGHSSRRSSLYETASNGSIDDTMSTGGKRPRHRSGITDSVLQLAPDTPKNAARKLLADIFSDPKTAALIYCNDTDVVVDVIIRQACDLPPSSPALSEYLFIMDKIIQNSEYLSRGGGYRVEELIDALRGVEYHAQQAVSHDYATSRSVRLATGLLSLLASRGKRVS